jgi:hypothetical protein
MRYPPDDAAEQSAGRRRSQHSEPEQSSQDGSVFVPGYDSRRAGAAHGGDPGQGSPRWHGSAAGKGPVRGYPPPPGQPPPVYPPGQFAAWNRRGQGQARHAAAGQPDPGRPPAVDPARPGDSGYYGRDSGAHTDPGYSMLAVSDPAADVTSTQTWQAVGDGRATGTWAAPARPAGPRHGASRPGGPGPGAPGPGAPGPGAPGPGAPGPGAPGPGDPAPGTELPGRRLAPWSPQAAAHRAGGTEQLSRDADALGRDSGPRSTQTARPSRDSGPHDRSSGPHDRISGPHDRPAGSLAEPAGRPGATGRRAARGRGAGQTQTLTAPAGAPPRSGRSSSGRQGLAHRGKNSASARFAIAGALAIVLVAGIALYVAARAASRHPATSGRPKPPATTAPASPSPTPSLGAYGYIGSRRGDPMPLTVAELYPASLPASGVQYVRTRSSLSKDCVDAVNGASLQGAVNSGSCSQVARATYLASKTGMMGTIGVLNLGTAKQATKAARAAGAQNFIVQLRGHKAPTSKIGHGPGLEEALAKGHYLILIWAELTTLKTPRKGAQRAGLAAFMTDLFNSTANVTLTDRMMSGSPSATPSGG